MKNSLLKTLTAFCVLLICAISLARISMPSQITEEHKTTDKKTAVIKLQLLFVRIKILKTCVLLLTGKSPAKLNHIPKLSILKMIWPSEFLLKVIAFIFCAMVKGYIPWLRVLVSLKRQIFNSSWNFQNQKWPWWFLLQPRFKWGANSGLVGTNRMFIYFTRYQQRIMANIMLKKQKSWE